MVILLRKWLTEEERTDFCKTDRWRHMRDVYNLLRTSDKSSIYLHHDRQCQVVNHKLWVAAWLKSSVSICIYWKWDLSFKLLPVSLSLILLPSWGLVFNSQNRESSPVIIYLSLITMEIILPTSYQTSNQSAPQIEKLLHYILWEHPYTANIIMDG